MGIILRPEDIEPFADIPKDKLEAMIADVEAVAVSVAPCIAKPGFKFKDAARAILRRALLRWNDSGVSGQVQYEAAGPFTQTIRSNTSSNLLWPSEVVALKKLCDESGGAGKAFTITPTIRGGYAHSDVCSTVWGEGCSCGSNINGCDGPLWEI